MATTQLSTQALVRQAVRTRMGRTLVLRLSLATGAVLLALGVTLDAVGRSTISALGIERERAQVELVAGVLDAQLAGIGRDASTLAGSCAARPNLDNATILALLTHLADSCKAFDALVLRPDGTVIPRNGWKAPPGYDPKARPWYQVATATKALHAITTPYTGAVSGELLITVAAAARGPEGGLTVVGIDLAVPKVLEDVRRLGSSGAMRVRVVDGEGRWILHEDAAQVLGGRIDGAPEAVLWRRFQVARTTTWERIEDRYAVIAPIPEAGWALLVELPTASIDGAVWRLTATFAIGTGLALAVLALVVWLSSYRIVRPVVRLAGLAQRVQAGDLSARADDSRDDELGLLARRFNELVTGIKENEVMRARLAESQAAQARLASQADFARDLRRALQPSRLPRLDGVELRVHRIDGRQQIGSFHDLFALDGGRLAVVLGEVRGDGVAAALFLAQLSTSFRIACRSTDDPGRVLALTNALLAKGDQAENTDTGEEHHHGDRHHEVSATASVALCRPASGQVSLACAGRVRPLLVLRGAGGAEWIQGSQGGSLGGMAGLPFHPVAAELGPHDIGLLVSDGVVEASPPGGVRFGEERLVRAALCRAGEGLDAVVSSCASALAAHLGGAPERDLTIIAWRRAPGAGAAQ